MTERLARLRQQLARHRNLFGKFVFELVVVFIAATGAFALENARQNAEEKEYRLKMIAALRPTLENVATHGAEIDRTISAKLSAFDAALARGDCPLLPVYKEDGGERPPTRVWDSLIATGAAKALEPEILFRLSRFYSNLDSVGERYVRYATVTENRVYALKPDHSDAYDAETGALKPEFRAYVTQLRELQKANADATKDVSALRHDLALID